MASLYPEIQVTKELNLHATVKVNKEAIHITANSNNFLILRSSDRAS